MIYVTRLDGSQLIVNADLIETVEHITIQSQNGRFDDVKTYSRDQQPATLRVSVNYHVTDARTVYTDYRTMQNMIDRLVTPQVYTSTADLDTFVHALKELAV